MPGPGLAVGGGAETHVSIPAFRAFEVDAV